MCRWWDVLALRAWPIEQVEQARTEGVALTGEDDLHHAGGSSDEMPICAASVATRGRRSGASIGIDRALAPGSGQRSPEAHREAPVAVDHRGPQVRCACRRAGTGC